MKARLTALIVLMTLGLISLICNTGFSQENQLDEKLEKITGNISKITIEYDGGTETFTGDEAEIVGKMLKSEKHTMIFLDEESEDHDFHWLQLEKMEEGMKNIEVEIGDNEDDMKVTVIKMEDGEEKTVVYEGEEAKKYLDEHGSTKDRFDMEWNDFDDDNIEVTIIDEENDDDQKIKIFVKKLGGNDKEKEIIIKKKRKEVKED